MQASGSTKGSIWGFVVSGWLLLMILGGGTSLPDFNAATVQTVVSVFILIAALFRLKAGFPTAVSRWGAGLGAAGLALVLLQLVPLPASVWQSFPGRTFVLDAMTYLGAPNQGLSLTLSPQLTWAAAKAFLPGLAGYLAALTLRPSDYAKVGLVFVTCALLGIGASVLQKLQGADSWFYLYGNPGNSNATGTFGNRNFFGAQLYSTIPFIAALAMSGRAVHRINGFLVAGFAIVYIAVLVVGLGTTGSRSGLIFSVVSVMATLIYVYRLNTGTDNRFQISKIVLAAVVLFGLISQVGMVALLRIANTDSVSEYRGTILKTSIETAQNFFPVGSGFGTFEQVYQVFEKPENMIDAYVNHAHNDWVEIVLEGGLPGAVLLIVFAVVFAVAVVRTSRSPFSIVENSYARAGVVSAVLLLLHSLSEFPLRTPALMVLFATCCGLASVSQFLQKVERKPVRTAPPEMPKSTTTQSPWKPVRR